MSMLAVMGLLLLTAQLALLWKLSGSMTLARQVLIALIGGVAFGLLLQFAELSSPGSSAWTLQAAGIISDIYVALLQMIIMPLVLITMIASVVRMQAVTALGRITASVIIILVLTTMIAALVGVFFAGIFGLSAEGLIAGTRELARAEVLEVRQTRVADLDLRQVLVRFVPTNIFSDLSGTRDTSIVAVVVFGILFGLAALLLGREKPEHAPRIREFTETAMAIIMRLVKIVMNLTPYGILALMTGVVARSSGADILNLLGFVLASYLAILTMFGVHALLLLLSGVSPLDFFRRIWPVLTFAFATRSSAATIPLNIRTQVEELKVPASIAGVSASFGATIGQNGCAGIYPAMLAVMAAPAVGIDPWALDFLLMLVLIIAVSSFGVAGVGGGATFAALIVLPAMGLPITLVALLISIEPLIDMGRTALNVSGAMTSGVITGRLMPDPDILPAAVTEP